MLSRTSDRYLSERVKDLHDIERHDHTLRPADLLDEEGLKGLIRSVES